MIEYRELGPSVSREIFSAFIRLQVVTKCWRKIDGRWVIKDAPFIDDWSEEDCLQGVAHLNDLLAHGGFVMGAFNNGELKGFVSVDARPIGGRGEYLDMTNIHISADLRGHGIGRHLFNSAADWARAQGAEKLYISAHSAVESQAFYKAMGCVDAQYISKRHAEKEPYDRQLEFVL